MPPPVRFAPGIAALCLVGLLSLPPSARAQDAAAPEDETRRLLLEAAAAFDRGAKALDRANEAQAHFEQAAKYYHDVSSRRPPNAEMLLNLGNSLFLAERLPEAILAYRRGLALDPNHPYLAENLDFARARVQYPFGARGLPPADDWPPWLYRPSPLQTLLAAFLVYSVAWVLALRWWIKRHSGGLVQALVAFGLAALLVFALVRMEQAAAYAHAHPLVVIRADRTPFCTGNGLSYPRHPDLPYLSRGMEARRLHTRGDWLQIAFASGEVGWVPRSAVVEEP